MENPNIIKSYKLEELDDKHIIDFLKLNGITHNEYMLGKQKDSTTGESGSTKFEKKFIITFNDNFLYLFELSSQDKTIIVNGFLYEKSAIESLKISQMNFGILYNILNIYLKKGEKLTFAIKTLKNNTMLFGFYKRIFSENVIKENEAISKWKGIREATNDEKIEILKCCSNQYVSNIGCDLLFFIPMILFISYLLVNYYQSMDNGEKIGLWGLFIFLCIILMIMIKAFFVNKKKTKEMENQKMYMADVYAYYSYETTSGPDDTKDWVMMVTDGVYFLDKKIFIPRDIFSNDRIEGNIALVETKDKYSDYFNFRFFLKK